MLRPALLCICALLALAPAAAAQGTATAPGVLGEAVDALGSDPVFVHPDAEEALPSRAADALRRRIARGDTGPVYVAVLPAEALAEAGGSTDGVLFALRDGLARPGTYAVVAGRRFGAGSTQFRARPVVEQVLSEHEGASAEVLLLAFLDGIAEARSGGGAPGGSGGSGGGMLLAILAALGLGGFALSRARRRKHEAAELAEVKREVRDDLVELGDGIRALDLDVQMPSVTPEVRDEFGVAVSAYERAEQAWELARRPEDLEPVGSALEEGRWALASVSARLEGRQPPERRPPCFFDPRHGPSTRDVVWAPWGGQPREVPACEADALRVEAGEEPASREVVLGGSRMPYWAAGPVYAPFAGGMYGAFGGLGAGLFGGMLLGSMLSPGVGWAGTGDHGGGDFGAGGDFGGGGLGGGDFGGGGFGGGDF
ncbi:MAG TPA: hypothetical protein VM266_16425 [Solirubrobacteraceae bacterium]|nr:hypothetical protein [Solirubrobacteraceae bacterium]